MRLLNSRTKELENVSDPSQVKFAILSHTWGNDGEEVLFKDLGNLQSMIDTPGYSKLTKTCDIAARKYKYVWIDTCCIDKTSSAELSEAINSMFRWYKEAQVCYVHLADFEPVPDITPEAVRRSIINKRLASCRWFTRGWTLQELIAPHQMEFFDKEWNFIGGKRTLEAALSSITQVPPEVLQNNLAVHTIPVARRMSWAAHRQTTRVEDLAYCLLGLFDIHMPLLYGEGSKAFLRLQEHIASELNDLSLFAWITPDAAAQYTGIFAPSPVAFDICSTIRQYRLGFQPSLWQAGFTITNKGLEITAWIQDGIICLNCFTCRPVAAEFLFQSSNEEFDCAKQDIAWLGIRLEKVGDAFLRARPQEFVEIASRARWYENAKRSTITICKQLSNFDNNERTSSIGLTIIVDHQRTADLVDTESQFFAHACRPSRKHQFEMAPSDRTSFIAIHAFKLKGFADRALAIVAGFKWTSEQGCGVWCGLFKVDVGNCNLPMIMTGTKKLGEIGYVEDICDNILIKYANEFGVIDGEKLPNSASTAVKIGWNRSIFNQFTIGVDRTGVLEEDSQGSTRQPFRIKVGYS
jgi:hypothetical protein